jgi:phosphatidylethanolamine/phosphatidyl-N-methylethanolamine N-methyltransferase
MMFLSQTFKGSSCADAVLPSSKKLVDLIADKTNLSRAKVIVELGPGNGVFTEEIVRKMNEKANYFAIEVDDNLIENFSQKFPSLKICHNSAENICQCLKDNGLGSCDRVISSLPWSAFEGNFQKKLVGRIYDALEDQGMFVIFSYCSLKSLEDGKSIVGMLKKQFKQVTETKISQNIPPVFLCVCKK